MLAYENFTKTSILEGQVLLVDKPIKWTSFKVVKELRLFLKKKFEIKTLKVGHAGTLDPLASGLLIICTGKMTKRIFEFQSLEKEYVGTMSLGSTTPSYDLETKFDKTFSIDHISENLLDTTREKFLGIISQCPPIFSAAKKNGKRLYKYAREGINVDIRPKKVEISKFFFKRIYLPYIDFQVNCSKGTYIRSLVHDFGKKLNSGAHLTALRRNKIGQFSVNNSLDINELIAKLNV